MDEIIGALLRIVVYVVSELFFGTLCYGLGWPVMWLVTWGRYPRKGCWLSGSREEAYVCCVGMLVLLFALLAILGQF